MLFDEGMQPPNPTPRPDADGAMTAANPARGVLFALLAAAIRNRTPEPGPSLSIPEWEQLTGTADAANLLPLLYPAAARCLGPWAPPPARLAAWRKTAYQAAMIEERRMREGLKVTVALAHQGLPCVAFKGMTLRALYPHPELRTMGDIDLLVRPEDVPSAEDTLKMLGLRRVGGKHFQSSWSSGPGSLIELHSALLDEPQPELERRFFEQAVVRQTAGGTFRAPAPEDAAVYQVLHMAKHLRYLGFGLRDLADLTLQLEQGVDVGRLMERLDGCGAGTFGRAVLLVCRAVLALRLSAETTAAWKIPPDTLRRLTDEIVSAGVHGKNSPEREWSRRVAVQPGESPGRFFLALAFPPTNELRHRYGYSRSRSWLLVAAWMHRLIRAGALSPRWTFLHLRLALRARFGTDQRRVLLAKLGLKAC
jgi:hypothetical protein